MQCFDQLLAAQSAQRYSMDDQESAGIADAFRIIGNCFTIAHGNSCILAFKVLGNPEVEHHLKRIILAEPSLMSLSLVPASIGGRVSTF